MLGPNALDAENAEDTLAQLDRLSAVPDRRPNGANRSSPAAGTSNPTSDIAGLSRIMEDTQRMQQVRYLIDCPLGTLRMYCVGHYLTLIGSSSGGQTPFSLRCVPDGA